MVFCSLSLAILECTGTSYQKAFTQTLISSDLVVHEQPPQEATSTFAFATPRLVTSRKPTTNMRQQRWGPQTNAAPPGRPGSSRDQTNSLPSSPQLAQQTTTTRAKSAPPLRHSSCATVAPVELNIEAPAHEKKHRVSNLTLKMISVRLLQLPNKLKTNCQYVWNCKRSDVLRR